MQNQTFAEPFESLTEEALARVSGGAQPAQNQITTKSDGTQVGPVLRQKDPVRNEANTLIFF